MECPKCKSETKVVNSSYPKTYECIKCGFTFAKLPSTFVDDI